MVSKKTVNTLLASAVALTIAGAAAPADAAPKGKEKCYGVVKAGHNDCANAAKTHSCAAQSTVDGDGGEWVALPTGVCDKLVGGSLEPFEGAHGADHEGHDNHGDAGHEGHDHENEHKHDHNHGDAKEG